MSVSLDRALEIIRENARPGEIHSLPPAITAGLVAAQGVYADFDVPEFPRSARDGFAIRAATAAEASFFKPVALPISQTIYADTATPPALKPGHAARILTGGAIPKGADCVVQAEDAKVKDGKALIGINPKPGEHLRAPGADLAADTLIAGEGACLTPEMCAAAVRSRVPEVQVYKRPECMVLALGNELRDPEDVVLMDDGFPADNPVLLRDLLRENQAGDTLYHVLPDAMAEIMHEIEHSEARLILTTGGTGNSEKDLARAAAKEGGFTMLFDGVDILPGRNTFLAERDGRLFFGLPGPPPAVLTCFRTLVLPALQLLRGMEDYDGAVAAQLTEGFGVKPGPVRLVHCEVALRGTRLTATPLMGRDLPSMQAMIETNGFLVVAPGAQLNKGDEVGVLLLRPLRLT
ncbi:molybdopterin molybdotransferase MoeA [Salidesulfovibrio onnuriiensis]|uniref:molybdopterin molybdotransferase MoeA n=1 Tax=Salidesulfovibrio onnuriiensis TaxID=2583823 RepID=UPI00164FBD5E|nr:molybdopterin molybdotransferase MoeA [Salidesulfovibrio onnuriiensis]